MKLFQKTALAVAIAAVPFLSVNALEALDDATLSNMTGQAGVTIKNTVDDTGISIGSIQYTDTDGIVSGSTDGGSVYIQGIRSKSSVAGGEVITTQNIDVDAYGNLVTTTTTNGTGKRLEIDHVQLRSSTQAAALGGSTGRPVTASTANSGANLVNDFGMTTSQTGIAYATILNLSDTATNGALTPANVYEFASGNTIDVTKAIGSNLAIVTSSSSQVTDLDVKLLDSAIEIVDMKVYDVDSTGAIQDIRSNQLIWADANGVSIQGSASKSTIDIATLKIGGNSIGSIIIRDINQQGSVTHIAGR